MDWEQAAWYAAAALVAVLIVSLLTRSVRGKKQPAAEEQRLPYRLRDDFLTEAEFAFYTALRAFLDDSIAVCPKVNLADIFFAAGEKNARMAHINKINRKHVDFLLCDAETMVPLCGIELDDSSHQRADRIERDAFVDAVYAAADLPLVHAPLKNGFEPEQLRDLLSGMLERTCPAPEMGAEEPQAKEPDGTVIPACPKCGELMVLRVYRRGEKKGYRYYGCPNYPKCKAAIDYIRPVL